MQAGVRRERFELLGCVDNPFDEECFTYVDNDIGATLEERREIGLRSTVRF